MKFSKKPGYCFYDVETLPPDLLLIKYKSKPMKGEIEVIILSPIFCRLDNSSFPIIFDTVNPKTKIETMSTTINIIILTVIII